MRKKGLREYMYIYKGARDGGERGRFLREWESCGLWPTKIYSN